MHSQVTHQNVSAQARICVRHRGAAESAMSSRMSRRARCAKPAAVTRGGAGQARPRPQAWQLPDCAASLDLHNILTSAVEDGVIERRRSDTRAALPSQTHTTDGKDETAQEVARLMSARASSSHFVYAVFSSYASPVSSSCRISRASTYVFREGRSRHVMP